jgi:hypothetical protein
LAFIKAVGHHWTWWIGSTVIASLFAVYQGGGGVIPTWLLWTWALVGVFIATFLAWRDQYKKVQELTKRTGIEMLDDLLVEWEELEEWYGGDAITNRDKLDALIKNTRVQIRASCPDYMNSFNQVVKNPTVPLRFPKKGRTMLELGEWLKDTDRQSCWVMATACVGRLREVRKNMASKLPL